MDTQADPRKRRWREEIGLVEDDYDHVVVSSFLHFVVAGQMN